MTDSDSAIEDAIARSVGSRVRILRSVQLGGGSINDTTRVETTAGVYVVKAHRRGPRGMFHSEAEGLNALRTSGTTLVIPRVVAVGPPQAARTAPISTRQPTRRVVTCRLY